MSYLSAPKIPYVYQTATVVSVTSTTVTLATIRLNTCQQCVMKAGCGHRLLNKTQDCEKSQIKLPHPVDRILLLGQDVTIAVPQHTFLLASIWLFLVPLLLMLTSALVVQMWVVDELYIVGAGLFGLLLGLFLMRSRIAVMQNNQSWQPFIVTPET